MSRIPVRTIVYLGVLTALEIVLSRFLSISAWNLKIGFSSVPVALAGMLFGPLAGGIVGALGDLLGAVLFPIGPYFPGFLPMICRKPCCFLRKIRYNHTVYFYISPAIPAWKFV